ncbi:MAG: hypothetical protein M5U34_18305 [Chloroflexi bacterium]|nr:hypothetical protein [Chloroflexota bacterium]
MVSFLVIIMEKIKEGKRPFCGNMDLEMSGLETARSLRNLPRWWGGKRPFCPQLTIFLCVFVSLCLCVKLFFRKVDWKRPFLTKSYMSNNLTCDRIT